MKRISPIIGLKSSNNNKTSTATTSGVLNSASSSHR